MSYHDKNLKEIIADKTTPESILELVNKARSSTSSLKGGCAECAVVYADAASQEIRLLNTNTPSTLSTTTPITLVFNGVSNHQNWVLPGGWTIYAEIAKFGDKIWVVGRKPAQKAIIEFTLSSVCDSVRLSKIMPFSCPPYPNHYFNNIAALTAKDSTTLLVTMMLPPMVDPLETWRVLEVDVSGTGAIGTELYIAPTAPGALNSPSYNGTRSIWDMVYLSNGPTLTTNNSVIGANQFGDVTWFDLATGTVIDQQYYPALKSFAAFCHQGKVYLSSVIPGEIFEVNLSGTTISVDITNPITMPGNPEWQDAASSPACCDKQPVIVIKTYDCVNNNCVSVPYPNIGTYTSLSACQQYCGDGGWNCKTTTNIGQPGSYQTCVQVFLPNVGAYTTLSDCQNGFINGGFGPCKKPPTIPTLGSKLVQGGNDKPKKLHKNQRTNWELEAITVPRSNLSPEVSTLLSPFHAWSVCKLFDNESGSSTYLQWVNPIMPWTQPGVPFGPYRFGNNPFNIPPPPTPGPYTTPAYGDAFYNWVISQVGTLVAGDVIEFDLMTDPWSFGTCLWLGVEAGKICFKYHGLMTGLSTTSIPSFPWNGNFYNNGASPWIPAVTKNDCCNGLYAGDGYSCKDGICFPVSGLATPPPQFPTQSACIAACTVITTYKCVNGSCIPLNSPFIGPFTSLSACQQHCGKTWDCLEKPKFTQDEWAAIGVGGSIPTAYSCQEVLWPNIGTYATKQDCLDVCSASYTTYD